MEELAREYERKHEGHVTKITNYSFEFETVPNKDGKVDYTVEEFEKNYREWVD